VQMSATYVFTRASFLRHVAAEERAAAQRREVVRQRQAQEQRRTEAEAAERTRRERAVTAELGMWRFYAAGAGIEPPLRLGYSNSYMPSTRAGESYYDRQRREREAAARSSFTSRLGSSTTSRLGSSSDAEQLKEYMKSCGLEAWHSHFVKHTCVAHCTLTLNMKLLSHCQQAKSVRRLSVCAP
jgi:hypothetical protein